MSPSSKTIDPQRSINDILQDYPGAVTLLNSLHIDSCCRGHESLATAASALGLDATHIAENIVASEVVDGNQDATCSCGCSHAK
jgi:iron-sulfur cluster repair protein YtfE (RIC family)